MIDFHCHLLPALDDGAITVDDSIAMARALSDFGYQTICCTPHCIKGYYDLNAQKVREATLMLQADLDSANIGLELRPGMEYMLDECFSEFVDDLLPLGDTQLILCEAPQQAHPGVVCEGLELIIEKGFVPLIAHPERTDYFYEILTESRVRNEENEKERDEEPVAQPDKKPKSGFSFSRIWPFKRNNSKSRISNSKFSVNMSRPELPQGVLYQANLGSFTGYYGETVQRQAYELLKQGIYSALASDLHDGSSAAKILTYGKFESNPLLAELAVWNGDTQPPDNSDRDGAGQGVLF